MNITADILWEVLIKHTEDKERSVSSRLTCIRRCTHVCRAWRQLILGWPSVWAKLVVMNHSESKEWMEEVLRRTRSSPLHLSAELRGGNLFSDREASMRELFYHTAKENWDRMEVFSLIIIGEFSVMHVSSKLRSTFQRSAPLLQEFHIRVQPHNEPRPELPPDEDLDINIQSLFSNRAPFLQQFKSSLRHVSFHNPPTWCRALRALSMSGSNGMSIFKVMETLLHTPRLEDFHTESLAFGKDDFERRHTANFGPLNLPSLSSIRLRMTLHQFATFMTHVKLGTRGCYNVQCEVQMPRYIDLPAAVEFLRCLKPLFDDLLRGYRHLHWKDSKRSLSARLKIDTNGSIVLTWPGPSTKSDISFIIDLSWTFLRSPMHLDEMMKEAYFSLISSSLADLSKLSLTLYSKEDHSMDYLPLLQSFSSVSTLKVHGTDFFRSFWASLRVRRKNDPTMEYPFRKVHTLKTAMFSTWIDRNSSLLFHFFDFIRDCYDEGLPLHRLQLLEMPRDFISLSQVVQEFGYLEIFWTDSRGRELVYNSDCPEPVLRE